ncbi:hypothetical protein ANTQUA_LOCUS981 [Anthophora quadrimaculata]
MLTSNSYRFLLDPQSLLNEVSSKSHSTFTRSTITNVHDTEDPIPKATDASFLFCMRIYVIYVGSNV